MITIIVLFALAAVFGLTLIIPLLQGKTPTRAFVFLHGGLAAVALVLLIVRYVNEAEAVPVISLILFVIAALGGFVLFARDLQKQPIPKGLAVVHAGAAVVAFLILLFAAI
ncbi:MAG: hypothetical protein LOY03_17545 [Cyclobacteriaceae bacterium]|nr:hypothetical protein [Cyclobacteriaceae bacterium]